MDFSLSDEQVMLRDSVGRFVVDQHSFDQARANAVDPDGFSRSDWRAFGELGWLALMVPEPLGGIGGSTEDAAILMEGFGRGLVAAPYVSSAIIAPLLLGAGPTPTARLELFERLVVGELLVALATEEQGSHYDLDALLTRARREGDGFQLQGCKIVVPDGASADLFIVSARLDDDLALFLVPRGTPGLAVRAYRTIDGRRAADLRMVDVELPDTTLLISGREARNVLELALDTACVATAAEAIGCMSAAMEQTADYLKTRQQFGRTLSQFQTLTHRMADMFVRVENARSMLLRGLASLDGDAAERARAVSATMISILDAGHFVCGQSIQLHGGIGMADENMVGHFYKRVRAIGSTYGDREFHLQRHLSRQQGDRRSQ
jgi:alkylation response protein AidB-like acyl-CoA dehydrogenase